MQTRNRRGFGLKTPNIPADGLKIFAGIVMLIQSIGIIIIEKGMIHLDGYTQAELSQAMADDSDLMFLAGLGSVLQLIGGLAVPVFAFLLVEGFRHTSSYQRYLLTMVIFALLSEVPYDWANSGKIMDWSSQNALVTMCICLLMLYFLKMLAKKGSIVHSLGQWLIVLCSIMWVTICRAEFGLCMVLLVAVFYIFYNRNILKTVLGGIISLLYVTGPLAFYVIWFYDERRKDIVPKYVYYAFYPLHLLILGILARIG